MPTPKKSDTVQTVEQAVAYVEKHQRQLGQDAKTFSHHAHQILALYRVYKMNPTEPTCHRLLIEGVNLYINRFE